jgi:hypothetical protein
MLTLANFFEQQKQEHRVLRFWFDWNKDDRCEYYLVKEVLTNSNNDVKGLLLYQEDGLGYYEYYPMYEIERWALVEDDQTEE